MGQKKRIAKPKKLTSYQELHNNASPQRRSPTRSNVNNNNNIGQYLQSAIQTNMYHQQQQSMMSPNSRYHHQQQSQQQAMRSPNAIYHQSSYDVAGHPQYTDYYEPQQQHQYNGYNEEYGRAEREQQITEQIHHLTEQEQQIVRNINQRQRSQLNRAVQPRHRANSYGRQ